MNLAAVSAASDDDLGVMPVALPDPAPAAEGLVDVGDGHRLWHFDTGGDGSPVVLMHAGTGSGHVWGYQTPAFAAAGYRVVGYSRRGRMGSVVGDTTRAGSGAGDLLRLVEALGLGSFHLVGTAAGAMFAVDFAISQPRRLRSLVLSNTIVGVRDDDYRAIYRLLWPPGFDALPADFRELGPSYRHLDAVGRALWNELERRSRVADMPEQRFDNVVTWQTLAALPMPVLVSTGAADLYTPPSMARLVSSRIPGSELRIIPDSGHSSHWERPQLWNAMVLDFIGRHDSEALRVRARPGTKADRLSKNST